MISLMTFWKKWKHTFILETLIHKATGCTGFKGNQENKICFILLWILMKKYVHGMRRMEKID